MRSVPPASALKCVAVSFLESHQIGVMVVHEVCQLLLTFG